ncbi:MAG TPA: thiamine-phosphate kinase [Alphaproteobacteria bacterium]|nr:thiamine-phosphate kinase [Alphaproteobacteria bacterium]
MAIKAHELSEFELIARYLAPLSRKFPGALGLSDDAAVFTPTAGMDIVMTCDAIVEGVHFTPDDPPDAIARKALRVNLSDLAAKGAKPVAYLMTLALPQDLSEHWIPGFVAGLAADQIEFGVALAGGDTVMTPGPLWISITHFGEVPRGAMLRRGGAKPDDNLYVSGTIGDGLLGLLVVRGDIEGLSAVARKYVASRYRIPQPRVRLGPRLLGVASAAMDISDGLVADLGHLARVSGVAAVVEEALVPLSPAGRAAVKRHRDLLPRILTGGDDYEILFSAPPASEATIAALAKEFDVPLTRIGTIKAGKGVTVLDPTGAPKSFEKAGWTHF